LGNIYRFWGRLLLVRRIVRFVVVLVVFIVAIRFIDGFDVAIGLTRCRKLVPRIRDGFWGNRADDIVLEKRTDDVVVCAV
jgi:hypothetical protein